MMTVTLNHALQCGVLRSEETGNYLLVKRVPVEISAQAFAYCEMLCVSVGLGDPRIAFSHVP